MRTVYAVQIGLKSRVKQSSYDIVNDLRSRITHWVVGKYDRTWRSKVQLPFDGTTSTPMDGHSVQSKLHNLEGFDLLSVEWAYPHDRDPSSMWHTSIVVGRHGDDVEAAITVRIATAQMTMRPVGYALGRPRIVTEMIDTYDSYMSGWRVPSHIEVIKTTDVERFTNEVLLAPSRALPVVVVTPDVWSGRLLVNPDEVFDAIKGFAHVVVIESKWAAFKLTDVLEKELSCYNGAARIYWPTFSLKSNPFDHRLYLPMNIEYWKSKGGSFGKYLFRMLAAISAFRFVEGPAIRAARKAIAESERTHLVMLAEEVKQGRATKEEMETKLLEALLKIDELTNERDQLQIDVETQKAAWGTYQNFMAGDAQPDAEVNEEPKPDRDQETFASVRAALDKAKADFPLQLVFLETADISANESPYKNPNRVYELLEALALVTKEWQDKNGVLGQSWEDALAAFGFEYKDKESKTSKSKWANEYSFTYKGKKRLFEQHITTGAKQADKCLSIHLYRDDVARILVIGHCGRHLTNTKS